MSLMINEVKNEKIDTHTHIDFATRDFDLVVLNDFVYQNQIFI